MLGFKELPRLPLAWLIIVRLYQVLTHLMEVTTLVLPSVLAPN
jgi:hypothetical protein